jgi:hypothetical protein
MRMQENDSQRTCLVQEVEQRMESYYESRMNELTSLQSKMLLMQGQLQNTMDENMQVKQREESLKTNANKTLVLQQALRTEIEQMRLQNQDLRIENEQLMQQSNQKQQNDAIVRRLDNERQYLKNQLASEITLKSELQNALTKSQQQLHAVQKQWTEDVDKLKEMQVIENQTNNLKLEQLLQQESTLKNDLLRLQNQNKEVKDGFLKSRDQLRVEQLLIENLQTNNRFLMDEVEALKHENNAMLVNEDKKSLQHKQQIDAINEALKEQIEMQNNEKNRLKDELSRQFSINSQMQLQTMKLNEDFDVEKKMLSKQTYGGILFLKIDKWRTNRVASFFKKWHTNNVLITIASQFRENVDFLAKKNSDLFEEEKTKLVNDLKMLLNNEKKIEIATLKTSFENDLKNEIQKIENLNDVAMKKKENEHLHAMKQLEHDFLYDFENLKNQQKLELVHTIDKKNLEIDDVRKKHKLNIQNFIENSEIELKNAIAENEKKMENKNKLVIEELTNKWLVEKEKIVETLTAEKTAILLQEKKIFSNEMKIQNENFEIEKKMLLLLFDEKIEKLNVENKEKNENELNIQKKILNVKN